MDDGDHLLRRRWGNRRLDLDTHRHHQHPDGPIHIHHLRVQEEGVGTFEKKVDYAGATRQDDHAKRPIHHQSRARDAGHVHVSIIEISAPRPLQ